MNIPLVKNTIDNKDIDKLISWLKTYPRLTKGDMTIEFERLWSKFMGVKHSIFVNSGSSANLLMVYSLIESGILKIGDDIIIPSLSWSTSLAPAIQFGLNPILCDCNKEDLSVDLEHLESLIKERRPKCMMIVPILGLVPQMDKIMDICEQNNVVLIEDACESLGSKFNGKQLGSFGLMSTFSTYFGHHISTIEGGMICTDDDEFANLLKSLRSHGWARDMDTHTQEKLRKQYNVDDFNSQYTFYHTGFNLRSTDLQAFIGIGQLEKLPMVVKNRCDNFKLYYELLDDSFWKPKLRETDYISNFAFPIIHEKRNELVKLLNDNDIENRPLLAGSLGKQPYWYKKYGVTKLPNVDDIDTFGLYLPNNHEMSEEEIKKVCDVLNSIV
jgi:CDP-6-deoxy-D-xylo-4-hexulose-3-dehydrase|tara:strand:+ start:3543 stop:4697 length:1155 start_codon:yes stop_codon:yes gene_type:complete